MTTLLTTKEVASMLRVSKQFISDQVTRGKWPVVRIGRRQYRFRKEDIEALMQAQALRPGSLRMLRQA